MQVAIGIPCGRMEPRGWQETPLLKLMNAANGAGFTVTVPWTQGGVNVAKNRNRLLALAEETGADAMLLLDSDVIPPPHTIEYLAALNAPVASGVYFHHVAPFLPQVYQAVGEPRRVGDREYPRLYPFSYLPEQPFEAAAVGAGCLFIRREVWLELAPRPFEFLYSDEEDLGEDFTFCWKVGQKFGPIRVHPEVICDHMTLFPVGQRQFEQGMAELWAKAGKKDLLIDSTGKVVPAP